MPATIKKWNFAAVALGVPGTGKSYAMAQRIAQEAIRSDAYVLVHDPTGSYDEPDFIKAVAPLPVFRHDTAIRAVQACRDVPRGIHIADELDADAVLIEAKKLSVKSVERERKGKYFPVIMLADEAVAAEGAQASKIDRETWLDAVTKRRHLGLGIAMTGQSTFIAHRSLMMMVNEVYCFRLVDPADHKRLMAVGMTKELTAQTALLRDRHAIVMSHGREIGRLPGIIPIVDGKPAAPKDRPTSLDKRGANGRHGDKEND